MAFGFLLIAICLIYSDKEIMFYLAQPATICLGAGQAVGQAVLLGFLKQFPGDTIGYFGSGSGFAGIFATSSLILLKAAGLSDGAIYLLVTPTMIPYFLSFVWLSK